MTQPKALPETSEDPANGAGRGDKPVMILVELSGRPLDFHRLLATLHRKNVGFSCLLFTGRRALVRVTPGHRSTEQLVTVIECEPVVIGVEVSGIETSVVDGVINQLLECHADSR